jgi:hypothetical protein
VQPEPREAWLDEFLAGWVLTAFSITFYRRVAQRPAWRALLFFAVFVALPMLTSIASLLDARAILHEGLPQVSIKNGRLSVEGEQPFVRSAADTKLVIDVTGKYTVQEAAAGKYRDIFLLTETEYALYTEGSPVTMGRLTDFGRGEINTGTFLQWLDIFFLAVFGVMFLLFSGWVFYVPVVGLAVWSLAHLLGGRISYRQVCVTGLYASVPASYIYWLSVLIGAPAGWAGILVAWVAQTAAWAYGSAAIMIPVRAQGIWAKRPLRAWRAALALPIIVLWITLNLPARVYAVLAALTWMVLVAVSIPPIRSREGAEKAGQAPNANVKDGIAQETTFARQP